MNPPSWFLLPDPSSMIPPQWLPLVRLHDSSFMIPCPWSHPSERKYAFENKLLCGVSCSLRNPHWLKWKLSVCILSILLLILALSPYAMLVAQVPKSWVTKRTRSRSSQVAHKVRTLNIMSSPQNSESLRALNIMHLFLKNMLDVLIPYWTHAPHTPKIKKAMGPLSFH